jgi:hypothetical protein
MAMYSISPSQSRNASATTCIYVVLGLTSLFVDSISQTYCCLSDGLPRVCKSRLYTTPLCFRPFFLLPRSNTISIALYGMADLQIVLYQGSDKRQLQYMYTVVACYMGAEANIPSTQPDSPLLSLPAEIRNHIYGLALQVGTLEAFQGRQSQNRPQALSLISTCRQLRFETLEIFYRTNTFDFAYMITHIPRFIRTVSHAARNAVRSIRIVHHDALLLLWAARQGQLREQLRLFPSLDEVVVLGLRARRSLRLAVIAAIRLATGKRMLVVRFKYNQ